MLNGLYSNVKVPILYLRLKKAFPFKTPIFPSSYIFLNSHSLNSHASSQFQPHIVKLHKNSFGRFWDIQMWKGIFQLEEVFETD